jgi:hypothetical protein
MSRAQGYAHAQMAIIDNNERQETIDSSQRQRAIKTSDSTTDYV